MTLLRTCDVCKMPDLTTLRYGLNRQGRPGEPGSANTTWGRGGIDLCDKCWTRVGLPKMRKRKAPSTG